MKRTLLLLLGSAVVMGAALFFWRAYSIQSFTREFRQTQPNEQRALFERYYGTLTPHQMATAIESTTSTCHGQAHDLGKVVYTHTRDIGEAFRACGTSCTEGCFHGVLMEALGTADAFGAAEGAHITMPNLAQKVSDICATAKDHRPGNCAHGIGHAFMYLADYHPDIALPLCKAFPTVPLQFYCSGGAYMELDTAGYALSCDDALPYPATCWTYKTRHLVREAKNLQEAAASKRIFFMPLIKLITDNLFLGHASRNAIPFVFQPGVS